MSCEEMSRNQMSRHYGYLRVLKFVLHVSKMCYAFKKKLSSVFRRRVPMYVELAFTIIEKVVPQLANRV